MNVHLETTILSSLTLGDPINHFLFNLEMFFFGFGFTSFSRFLANLGYRTRNLTPKLKRNKNIHENEFQLII